MICIKLRPDRTNNGRVTSPWLSKLAIIDLVNSLSSSFFVRSSWNTQITMPFINLGRVWKWVRSDQEWQSYAPLIVKNGHFRSWQSSFFIFVGSSWNLLIIMTCIKFRTSLKMGQIGPTMAELYSFDCQDCLWTLYRPRFQPNQLQTYLWANWLEIWQKASGWLVDQTQLNSLWSEIQDSRHIKIPFFASSPESKG